MSDKPSTNSKRTITSASREGDARSTNRTKRGIELADIPDMTPPPQPASAPQADMEEVTFTHGPARRPLLAVGLPLLQWSTGLRTAENSIYGGWLLQAGKDDELDSAMAEAGFMTQTIRHSGNNNVTHWAIETANLFVVALGVQTRGELRNTTDRYGISFGWRTLENGRGQSVLRFRAFLHELLEVGYRQPLLVTVKSTLTGDMIDALLRQYSVLDAIDSFRAQAGKPALQPPFYACSIPLGPGPEVSRGSVQTKEIVPIVAKIPATITKEYILERWIKRDWVPLIEGMLDDAVAWSITNSQQIAAGEEPTSEYGAEEQ